VRGPKKGTKNPPAGIKKHKCKPTVVSTKREPLGPKEEKVTYSYACEICGVDMGTGTETVDRLW
jgi:hypothetical protein